MRGTNQKILRAARLLFNEAGVSQVSQRTICDHIAISPGNLTYHFKKRDDIIEALYLELEESLIESLEIAENGELSLSELLEMTKKMNKSLFENRFFMIDFIQILRSSKRIKKQYTKLSNRRRAYLERVVNHLTDSGIMRPAELQNEYEYLTQRSLLFGDFWIASIGTTTEDVMLKHTRIFTTQFMQSFYPYLTEKGKASYLKLEL